MSFPAAIGTFEAFRPAPFDKRGVALLLASVLRIEVGFAEALLQLNLVARHRRFLPKTNRSMFVLSKNTS